MTDNVQITPGSGATVAADNVNGVLYQRVKVAYGVDGDAQDASSSSPFPVQVFGDVSVVGALTDAQLRASPVPVTGVITVSNGLTNAELRASPVPVTGVVTVTGALTNAELRASPVPVTGALTNAELRASPVPVTGELVVVEKTFALTTVCDIATNAGTTLIVAGQGPNTQLVIAEISMQVESATTNLLVQILNGVNVVRRWRFFGQGHGVSWVFDQGREMRLFENAPLQFNLSSPAQLGYTVRYYVESL